MLSKAFDQLLFYFLMCAYLYLYPLCSGMCPQGVRLGVRPDSPALPRPSRTIKVETGCNVGNPCNSSPCPTHSQCTDEWDRHTCVCEPGKMSIMIVQNQKDFVHQMGSNSVCEDLCSFFISCIFHHN